VGRKAGRAPGARDGRVGRGDEHEQGLGRRQERKTAVGTSAGKRGSVVCGPVGRRPGFRPVCWIRALEGGGRRQTRPLKGASARGAASRSGRGSRCWPGGARPGGGGRRRGSATLSLSASGIVHGERAAVDKRDPEPGGSHEGQRFPGYRRGAYSPARGKRAPRKKAQWAPTVRAGLRPRARGGRARTVAAVGDVKNRGAARVGLGRGAPSQGMRRTARNGVTRALHEAPVSLIGGQLFLTTVVGSLRGGGNVPRG